LTIEPDMTDIADTPQGEILPRSVLIGIGVLVLAVFTATAVVRLSGVSIHEPDAATLQSRSLRFEDGPAGSVLVIDALTGTTAASINGEQGFLRGTLRAMARERRKAGAGAESPFDLILRADGRLTLVDPVTRERIDLESFGPTNQAVFTRLLSAGAPTRHDQP
jgi:putative photosynthetic complex assembly protein